MLTMAWSTGTVVYRLKDLSINWNSKDFYFISADIDSLFTSITLMQGNCLAIGNGLAIVAANCFVFKLERKLFSILQSRPLF